MGDAMSAGADVGDAREVEVMELLPVKDLAGGCESSLEPPTGGVRRGGQCVRECRHCASFVTAPDPAPSLCQFCDGASVLGGGEAVYCGVSR